MKLRKQAFSDQQRLAIFAKIINAQVSASVSHNEFDEQAKKMLKEMELRGIETMKELEK